MLYKCMGFCNYMEHRISGGGRVGLYKNGFRYCVACEKFLKTRDIRCPCCNCKFRFRSRVYRGIESEKEYARY